MVLRPTSYITHIVIHYIVGLLVSSAMSMFDSLQPYGMAWKVTTYLK